MMSQPEDLDRVPEEELHAVRARYIAERHREDQRIAEHDRQEALARIRWSQEMARLRSQR